MKAVVNADTCIGCTLCVQTCPGVFKMEGDKAIAYVDVVAKDSESSCRQAVDECPVAAIAIK
jgi:ferredoxin